MAERAKFEKWLRDLDAKRETTPAHVLERVQKDYSGRLEGVLEKLKQHTSAMDDHARNLSEQLEKLTSSEQDLRDRHAESELRAQVGELTDSEWDAISKRTDQELAKLKQDQELIAADINRIREILGSVEQPVGQAAPDAGKAPATGGDQDELEFLKSVIGTPARSSTPASPAPRTSVQTEAKSEGRTDTKPDTRTDRKAEPVAAKAATAEPSKPPVAKPESLREAPVPGPKVTSKSGGEEPLAVHVTGSNPIVLRTSGVVEQPKTLKCAECGSMNYPSEWYCERCGAELANI